MCVSVVPVCSSWRLKQAVNQPDPNTVTFHQQFSTLCVCHPSLFCSAPCHASLLLHSAAGFYKAVTPFALWHLQSQSLLGRQIRLMLLDLHCNCTHVSGTRRVVTAFLIFSPSVLLFPRLLIPQRIVTTRCCFTTRWNWGTSMPTSPLRLNHG